MARDGVEKNLQCINQAPGLSVGNAITTQPLAGRVTVSRRGGFAYCRFAGSVVISKVA